MNGLGEDDCIKIHVFTIERPRCTMLIKLFEPLAFVVPRGFLTEHESHFKSKQ